MNYIYAVIYTVCFMTTFYLFISTTCEKKQLKHSFLWQILWISIQYVITTLLDNYFIFKLIGIIAVNTILTLKVYYCTWKKSIALSITYQTVAIVSDFIILIFVKYILNLNDILKRPSEFIYFVLGIMGQILVVCFVSWHKRKYKKKLSNTINKLEWIMFLFVPLFSLSVMVSFLYNFSDNINSIQKSTIMFITYGMVFINILIFSLFYGIIEREEKIKNDEILLRKTDEIIRQFDREQSNFERIKKVQHDYMNHMLIIRNYSENKEIDKLKKYINEYINNTQINENYIDTNNEILNKILNIKFHSAREKNITMLLKIEDMSRFPLKETEIVTIFSNLLDNAIEACENTSYENKYIKVLAKKKKNSFFISITNTWSGKIEKKGKKIISSKNNKMHGVGLSIVSDVIKKYNGEVIIKDDDKDFCVILVIPE